MVEETILGRVCWADKYLKSRSVQTPGQERRWRLTSVSPLLCALHVLHVLHECLRHGDGRGRQQGLAMLEFISNGHKRLSNLETVSPVEVRMWSKGDVGTSL